MSEISRLIAIPRVWQMATMQSVTHTRTHAATHNSNRKWQQQPAEAEAGSDGDRERFTDRHRFKAIKND
ncbi:hypothetical protein P167DRAFT_153639 [Morchella conica CCBAS932]|uniref:Uncharacterized protein n=1 Tax=Morchella conica CCBAS932 TaxID=1392247 RepID=A0A3N4KQK5_9PEZI|nr:hypothetical protein P167DRAFT_153639 [Morchella conica CCBAS932]